MSVEDMSVALTVPSRFCGPAGSANGGYLCGRVAGYLDGPVTVTLRQPPPLDTPMTVESHVEGSVRIYHGETLIAEAAPGQDGAPPPVPGDVSAAEAHAASGGARYFQDPVFPSCFVCGPRREAGDGLRIFPGPVPGRPLWAAPWTPDASLADGSRAVPPEIAWAALDCPSGIAAAEALDIGRDTAILLGRMTTDVAELPEVGAEYRVIGWLIGRDGRKLMAGSALLGRDGRALAVARALWLTVPRSVSGAAAS